jgi:hypothetical protein
MEESGLIFDPEYYLVDEKSHLIYRKEQFRRDGKFPSEWVVRDRRYSRNELVDLCERAGIVTNWVRCCGAGTWRQDFACSDVRAKEILYCGRMP